MISVPERNAIILTANEVRPLKPELFERTMVTPDRKHVVVPYTLHSCAVLARFGYRPEGPIRTQYSWPIRMGRKPFAHQVATADFLTQNPRAFVFNEIGTAKTMSALWAADYLMNVKSINKMLIVSPLSTLLRVWGDEIFCNFPHRSFAILHGSRQKRLKLLAESHDFYIINPDGLKVIGKDIAARRDINAVIVDEGAVFRNSKTDVYKHLDIVAGVNSGRSLWWMTGSPMPQAPTDVWAQARMINPSLVPRYFSRFRDEVMVKVTQFKWVARKGWEAKVYNMLKPSVRYKRDECIDLPPCTIENRQVDMSAQQKKAYTSMMNDLVIEMNDGKITAANEGVKIGKLLQIAGGSVYNGDGETVELDCKPKVRALIEEIESAGSKVIIFAAFKHIGSRLAKELSAKFRTAEINGDVPVRKRNNIFHDFQSGDLQVLVAHPQCMAHGLTLTAAHTVIWATPSPSYEHYEQANGRITRPGQTVKQTVVHLYTSEVEHRVYQRLAEKGSMQGLLLELLTS